MTKNYYNILDVDPKADDKEIKSAFYAQSKKLHPDVSPEDSKAPDKFKELVEAYEVLSDSKKRQTYDDALGATKREPTFHSNGKILSIFFDYLPFFLVKSIILYIEGRKI